MRRRRKLKVLLIEHFGGACEVCGYSNCVGAMHFHHLDPSLKEFDISNSTRSFERLVKEAEKCLLVCANHHAEAEAGILDLTSFRGSSAR